MKASTYASTDWIEVHDFDSSYFAKVFVTQNEEAYMIVRIMGKTKFFRVNWTLLALGEIKFFENVMKSAKELPFEEALKMRLV